MPMEGYFTGSATTRFRSLSITLPVRIVEHWAAELKPSMAVFTSCEISLLHAMGIEYDCVITENHKGPACISNAIAEASGSLGLWCMYTLAKCFAPRQGGTVDSNPLSRVTLGHGLDKLRQTEPLSTTVPGDQSSRQGQFALGLLFFSAARGAAELLNVVTSVF